MRRGISTIAHDERNNGRFKREEMETNNTFFGSRESESIGTMGVHHETRGVVKVVRSGDLESRERETSAREIWLKKGMYTECKTENQGGNILISLYLF